ncbi:hypothetical protein AALF16_21960 [Bacillus cereus]|uniref:hypothetical protein n=1 Tax=Bacillus cereus TaxID=1396 RepID=UPI00356EC4B7
MSQIHNLVKTSDLKESIHVVDYDGHSNPENVEFVIAVGVKGVAEQMRTNSEFAAVGEFFRYRIFNYFLE